MDDDTHFLPHVRRNKNSATGKSLRISKPYTVLPVDDKEELLAQLQHYSRPFIRHVVPNSTFARLNYVECLRPALRYYCAKYGVEVPKWLKSEDYYRGLPDDEKLSLFGTTEIASGEFRALKRSKGRVHVG